MAKKIATEKTETAGIPTAGQPGLEKTEIVHVVAAEQGTYGTAAGETRAEDTSINTKSVGKKIASIIHRLWQNLVWKL